MAVLKLLTHTAKNFPGVFYHGKATAVLPIIVRLLPFLAEPAFQLVTPKLVLHIFSNLWSFRVFLLLHIKLSLF